jgi:demethylmenaquinone methyltransferase / 2-methoxy-6-polyprenyl-1,4-benzoquinol methylase
VLSLGQDRNWRKAVIAAVDPQPGERVLDLAAGTGTSSQPFADAGATVVPCDFSLGMLRVGKEQRPHLPFTAGDGTRLPFADDTFDAVTISFGLRNIVDPEAGLREMRRVTRPGGRLVVCEFSRPQRPALRLGYAAYMRFVMPAVATAASSNREAYSYLRESIQQWPDQGTLSQWIRGVGFTRVAYRNLTAGVVALHRGHKPEDAAIRASAAQRRQKRPAP